MDTVPPRAALEPFVDDEGVVRNAGGTILGADNKSALAAMLVAVRRLVAERLPHAGVELVITTMEEVGLVGVEAFDHDRLAARVGFVYDQAAPIGEVVLGAPHQRVLEATFHGRAAHAGMVPEEGRSAIAAAARAIADFRLGRLDHETTASVGLIEGGSARNVVPELCTFVVDLRSHDAAKLADLVQELQEGITFAATAEDCRAETRLIELSRGYAFRRDDEPVRLAAAALARAGYEPAYGFTGGGSDANVFNERGRACANLANGMAEIHGPDEHVAVADLEAMVEVTLALVDEAREPA
jgi:tripeptide aminopeptidase